jgi:hypothetical protein
MIKRFPSLLFIPFPLSYSLMLLPAIPHLLRACLGILCLQSLHHHVVELKKRKVRALSFFLATTKSSM